MKSGIDYNEIQVNGFLSNFLDSFWKFNHPGPGSSRYEILPDGHFDMICEVTKGRIRSTYLTGVWTKQTEVSIPADTLLLSIRFKLLAAEHLFGGSIKSLKDRKTTVSNDLLNFHELKSFELAGFADAFSSKIQAFLKDTKGMDARKFKLFNRLYTSRGQVSVAELSESLGWSSRQINRYFNNKFGFSLKTFTNILKCKASYPHIAKGRLHPEKNYYDQPHFIKEIKRYTGVTPKMLHRNENDRFLQLSMLRKH